MDAPLVNGPAKPPNIIKCRDDPKPVSFERSVESTGITDPRFILSKSSQCSWVNAAETFGPEKLRGRIEPWLTALCQSEHLSLLLGSGLPNAVHRIATGKLLSGMGQVTFGDDDELISNAAKASAAAAKRSDGNIEDQIRAANELLRGLEILGLSDKAAKVRAGALRTALGEVLGGFAAGVLKGEEGLVTAADGKREIAFNYLVSFLMSFASRAGTRDRLHIFTTNYDRVIEAGAEAAGLYLLDRFLGSLAPVFRSSRLDIDMHYNPPGIRGEPRYVEGVARFTKLHGSLDWFDFKRSIRRIGIPFGASEIAPFLRVMGENAPSATQLMIYPNSAKDRETAGYPYVELFRDLAASVCRPNHTLIAFGYSFGDEHINRVIEDMLTIPSTHLVIIAYDDPLQRIEKLYDALGRHAQISVLIGDHVGEFKSLVDHYLPKPAIDRTTFRMAELLKARWGTSQDDIAPTPPAAASTDGGAS